MSAIDWAVIIGGLMAIGWINWYFFIASVKTVHETASGARNTGQSRETPRQ